MNSSLSFVMIAIAAALAVGPTLMFVHIAKAQPLTNRDCKHFQNKDTTRITSTDVRPDKLTVRVANHMISAKVIQ